MLSEEQIKAAIVQACGHNLEPEAHLSINAFRSVMASLAHQRFRNQTVSASMEGRQRGEERSSEEPDMDHAVLERELDIWVEHELKPAILSSGCQS